jgi:hypothetical protein
MPSARPARPISKARRMRAGAYDDGGLSSASLDLDPEGTHEPVSVKYRTGLQHAETEIGKWRPETDARNPTRKG